MAVEGALDRRAAHFLSLTLGLRAAMDGAVRVGRRDLRIAGLALAHTSQIDDLAQLASAGTFAP